MSEQGFKICLALVGVSFAVFFFVTITPPLLENPDVIAAVLAGFVNPYAAGYATDAIACWLVLMIWVVYEATRYSVKYGWLCLIVGVIPGVASGFALYLLIRHRQLKAERV